MKKFSSSSQMFSENLKKYLKRAGIAVVSTSLGVASVIAFASDESKIHSDAKMIAVSQLESTAIEDTKVEYSKIEYTDLQKSIKDAELSAKIEKTGKVTEAVALAKKEEVPTEEATIATEAELAFAEKEDTTSANLVEDVTEETAEEPTEESSSADITAEDVTTELVTTEATEVTTELVTSEETEATTEFVTSEDTEITTEETELAKANAKKSKEKTTEAVDKKQQSGIEATEATEEATAGAILVEDDSYQPGTYLGTYTTTAYCGCSRCCGKSDGITASGTYATEGRTIAAPSSFAFGTELIIDGHTYVVEDRGGAIHGNRIDIFFSSHQAALNYGRRTVDVYVK